jgi:DNA-binding response OmpR family regulator
MSPSAARGRVLVLDDESLVHAIVEAMLLDAGYEVVPYTSVEEALVQPLPPVDVVLLDLRMPGLEPAEVVSTLRARPETCQAAILILSAARDLASAARALGAEDYLAKPFDMDELITAVDRLVQDPSSTAAC